MPILEHLRAIAYFQGPSYYRFLIFTIWICGLQDVALQKTMLQPKSHVPDKFMLSDPPSGLFDPMEISPAVLPPNPYPVEPPSPMYPSFPDLYEPVLTGRCPVNFSSISSLMDKTASDCSEPLAAFVGYAICCPQVNSLMHIFLGAYNNVSSALVLLQAAADDCFADIISILASRGANSTIPYLCSVKSSNLTGGSCPVMDAKSFEKVVNTSKLLDACSTIDPLKECCRPSCQPAIVEAALHISSGGADVLDNSNISGDAVGVDVVNDCKTVVYAWLSRKLSPEAANSAFRILSSCKVNKVCPLKFKEPSDVINACHDLASPNPSCCNTLNAYVATLQSQMLITNRQAINCATLFGSMLQKSGVMRDIYKLCDVDLKDFSLQAYGQGCLLQSLPTDIIFDNATGFSFTCDLSDNIVAPWPSSSSLQSLSFCAPEMSLPALPLPASGSFGTHLNGARILTSFIIYLISCMIL